MRQQLKQWGWLIAIWSGSVLALSCFAFLIRLLVG